MRSRVDPSQRDFYELNMLASLQDERALLAENRRRSVAGFNRLMNEKRPGAPMDTPAKISSVEDEDMGIVNRSPTVNNTYPIVMPTASKSYGCLIAAIIGSALFLVIAIALLFGMWLFLSQRANPPAQTLPAFPDYGIDLFVP